MAKPKDEAMGGPEFGQLRAYLAVQGISQAMIDEAVGTAPNGRTRNEVAADLRAWLRTRPKA